MTHKGLGDSVTLWVGAMLTQLRDSCFNLSFNQFQAEMKKVYDHPVRGKEAASCLLSLRQGRSSVANYAESGWDDLAVKDDTESYR